MAASYGAPAESRTRKSNANENRYCSPRRYMNVLKLMEPLKKVLYKDLLEVFLAENGKGSSRQT